MSKMENHKKRIITVSAIGVAVALIIGGVLFWWFMFEQPHRQAVAEFDATVKIVESKNAELDKAAKSLESVVSGGGEPLDSQTKSDATAVLKKARQKKRTIPANSGSTEEIKQRTELLKKPLDYSGLLKEIGEREAALTQSIAQLKQVTAPSQDFVMDRLKTVPTVQSEAAATEDHDPNNKLNKAGGYTAAIYFESADVDQSQFSESDLIEKGTDAGGQIEVYKTREDAEKRNTYLGAFDGGLLSSGAHSVEGTCVVRASSKMTATQQKEITNQVIAALTALQ